MCLELAYSFCPDGTPEEKLNDLAATIQDTIEDWLSSEQYELDAKEQAGDQRVQ
jgi:hypothetical protein